MSEQLAFQHPSHSELAKLRRAISIEKNKIARHEAGIRAAEATIEGLEERIDAIRSTNTVGPS